MKLLIHICCAPCLIGPLETLRAEGHDVEGLFYNPNIHPLLEFRKRVKGMRVFMQRDPLPVQVDESYGLQFFVEHVYSPQRELRCERCHYERLKTTVQRAKAGGYDGFTSTLLGSPHRDHEMVQRIGERAAQEAGTTFVYRDFRSLSERGHEEARKRGIYLQPYCGCCFSEYERFKDTSREIYRG